MPDVQQGDVYKILSDIKKQALGISDTMPAGLPGIIVSFLPTGEPINPDDFTNPWKPNMTSPSTVKPPTPAPAAGAAPAAAGTADTGIQDTSDIGKRYENLSNTCTLVDKKLMLSENYQAIENGASISQAWEIAITDANVMPLPPEQEAFQKQQRDKYLPRLRITIKDQDGSDLDVDTKEYKAYKEYEKKYNNAVRNYANIYLANMSNRQTAQLWGVMGKTYVSDVNDAWDEWTSLGNKQFIEEAKDNLAAMGTDAAAHMIAAAKKKFEAYRVATSGVIPVTSQYVELFPSNWAEAGNNRRLDHLYVRQQPRHHHRYHGAHGRRGVGQLLVCEGGRLVRQARGAYRLEHRLGNRLVQLRAGRNQPALARHADV